MLIEPHPGARHGEGARRVPGEHLWDLLELSSNELNSNGFSFLWAHQLQERPCESAKIPMGGSCWREPWPFDPSAPKLALDTWSDISLVRKKTELVHEVTYRLDILDSPWWTAWALEPTFLAVARPYTESKWIRIRKPLLSMYHNESMSAAPVRCQQ